MSQNDQQLTVRVAATSANLGPGFDCLGIAFKLYNYFTFRWHNFEEAVSPEEQLDCLAKAPASQMAMLEAYVRFACYYDLDLPLLDSVKLLQSSVPVSRGLGSSATCYVAGARAAQWAAEQLYRQEDLTGDEPDLLSRDAVLAIATDLEGHPDNVTPAVYGSLCLSSLDQGAPRSLAKRVFHLSLPVSSELGFIAAYPSYNLKTKNSRAVLPDRVSLADSIFNLQSVTCLIKGLEVADPALLARGLKDKLHQPYRAQLIEGFYEKLEACKTAGAVGSVLSGAGPAILSIYLRDQFACGRVQKELSIKLGKSWTVLDLEVDQEGYKAYTGEKII